MNRLIYGFCWVLLIKYSHHGCLGLCADVTCLLHVSRPGKSCSVAPGPNKLSLRCRCSATRQLRRRGLGHGHGLPGWCSENAVAAARGGRREQLGGGGRGGAGGVPAEEGAVQRRVHRLWSSYREPGSVLRPVPRSWSGIQPRLLL